MLPRQGDLYLYPASFPHVVRPVSAGQRRSLVIALRAAPPKGPLADAFASAAAAAKAAASAGRTVRTWLARPVISYPTLVFCSGASRAGIGRPGTLCVGAEGVPLLFVV